MGWFCVTASSNQNDCILGTTDQTMSGSGWVTVVCRNSESPGSGGRETSSALAPTWVIAMRLSLMSVMTSAGASRAFSSMGVPASSGANSGVMSPTPLGEAP